MTVMCQTYVTKQGVTSRDFNVPTLFCALSTDLALPYMSVFVFDREMVLSAHLKRADSSFGSTLVHEIWGKSVENLWNFKINFENV